VCLRRERRLIDDALACGRSPRDVGREYGIARRTLELHIAHLSASVQMAIESREVEAGVGILETAREFRRRALVLLNKAELAGGDHWATAVSCLREARANLEFEARLVGEIKTTETLTDALARIGARTLDEAQRAVRVVREAEGVDITDVVGRAEELLSRYRALVPEERK